MEDFIENEKKLISPEDMLDSIDYMEAVEADLLHYSDRLTGTKSETACARSIRDKLNANKNIKTRLEAYKAYPLLGRGVFPLLGVWFLLSFTLYYISFSGKGVAGILLTLISLLVFLSGAAVLFMLYLGDKKVMGVLNSKISYNVVSEFEKNKDKYKKVIIITDNHDAMYGSYSKNFQLIQKLAFIATPLTAIVFVLFCILKMALDTSNVSNVIALAVVPAIIGIAGTAIIILHYSPFDIHARDNNGKATSLALTTYLYFASNPDLVKDDVKLVYASFGGENSGHGGSAAFVKAHPEYSKAKVICLADINSADYTIVEADPIRNINYPTNMISSIKAAAREQGIDLPTLPHNSFKEKLSSLHGFSANEFNKKGINAVSIIAKEYFKQEENHIDKDVEEKLFSITVASISKLMMDYDSSHTEDTKSEGIEIATGLEVLDSKGK